MREIASTQYGEACDAYKMDVLAVAASARREDGEGGILQSESIKPGTVAAPGTGTPAAPAPAHTHTPTSTPLLTRDSVPGLAAIPMDGAGTWPSGNGGARLVPQLSVLGERCYQSRDDLLPGLLHLPDVAMEGGDNYDGRNQGRDHNRNRNRNHNHNPDVDGSSNSDKDDDDDDADEENTSDQCSIPDSIATLLPPCAWDEYYTDPYVEATTQCFWHALGKRHYRSISEPTRNFGRICMCDCMISPEKNMLTRGRVCVRATSVVGWRQHWIVTQWTPLLRFRRATTIAQHAHGCHLYHPSICRTRYQRFDRAHV